MWTPQFCWPGCHRLPSPYLYKSHARRRLLLTRADGVLAGQVRSEKLPQSCDDSLVAPSRLACIALLVSCLSVAAPRLLIALFLCSFLFPLLCLFQYPYAAAFSASWLDRIRRPLRLTFLCLGFRSSAFFQAHITPPCRQPLLF